MPGKLYATSGSIRLFWMSEDDRNDYERLLLDTPEARPGYKLEKLTDLYWDTVLHSGDFNFVIYDDSLGYCGNVSLQHPESDFPEIGIELFKECRNRGIGPEVVKLLIREEQKYRPKESYKVRISSKNEHSIYVFEKLGAVLTDTRENVYKNLITSLQQMVKDADIEEQEDVIQDTITGYEKLLQSQGDIYEYKLYTDSVKLNKEK